MATLRIKPSHPSQGDFVIIEEESFDAKIHQLYVENEVIEEQIEKVPEPEADKESVVKHQRGK